MIINGTDQVQMFIHIVLPSVASAEGVITALCVINSLKIFDIAKTMTGGGPYYTTDVVATYVYRSAFLSEIGMPKLGYASAAALFFGAVVIVVGMILSGVEVHLDKKNW